MIKDPPPEVVWQRCETVSTIARSEETLWQTLLTHRMSGGHNLGCLVMCKPQTESYRDGNSR